MSTAAVTGFISRLVVHFGEPKFDVPDADKLKSHKAWLTDMIRNLGGYSPEVLDKAAEIICATRKYRSFPLLSECKEACRDADDFLRRQRPAMQLDDTKKYPEWSDDRLRLADDLVQTELGRRAAREGWILALWNFARENLRLPSGPEIARCIASSKDFDEAYERLVRDPSIPLAPNLIRLGDSMLARRERLRALVLEGVIA